MSRRILFLYLMDCKQFFCSASSIFFFRNRDPNLNFAMPRKDKYEGTLHFFFLFFYIWFFYLAEKRKFTLSITGTCN
jgi:hypothetical protein